MTTTKLNGKILLKAECVEEDLEKARHREGEGRLSALRQRTELILKSFVTRSTVCFIQPGNRAHTHRQASFNLHVKLKLHCVCVHVHTRSLIQNSKSHAKWTTVSRMFVFFYSLMKNIPRVYLWDNGNIDASSTKQGALILLGKLLPAPIKSRQPHFACSLTSAELFPFAETFLM